MPLWENMCLIQTVACGGGKTAFKIFPGRGKAAQGDPAPLASNGLSHCNPFGAIPGHIRAHT